MLRFRAGVYAFTAHRVTDPGHSNWSGKSFLLEIIRFAITGQLNKHRKGGKEGWITNGEEKGLIKLVFEDGSWVSREKFRGKPLQVRFSKQKNPPASQAEAERLILEYLRFNESDFQTLAYFAQGEMARLIRAEPSKKLEAIRGWFGLALAEKAEKKAKELATARVRMLQKSRAKKETLVQLLSGHQEPSDEEETKSLLAKVEELLASTTDEYMAVRKLHQHRETVREYKELVQEGKLVALEVKEYPEDMEARVKRNEEKYQAALKVHSLLEKDVLAKKKVLLGRFDGNCPIASIECPAKDEINEDRESASKAYQAAKAKLEDFQPELDKRTRVYNYTMAASRALAAATARLETFRERWEVIRADYKQAKKAIKKAKKFRTEEELEKELSQLRSNRDRAMNILSSRKSNLAQRAQYEANIKAVDEFIEQDAKQASDLIKVKEIFRVAQRRVSERNLAQIGDYANLMMVEAGIDLNVEIQWEYEGKKLAGSCEMCGAAFPSSDRIKKCEECGAERGKIIVQDLDFLMSDTSGAADASGGIWLQLSAGSWLLAKRDSPWTTAMIDEPFGEMDRTVRRAAAKQLLQLIGRSAYRQVFVISHAPETVDMYPNRVHITVEENGDRRIEVING